MTISRVSSWGLSEWKKTTNKFPNTMMVDKIITEIATILHIVFEFPALSQTCLKTESPVIFQKFKSLVTVAILRSTGFWITSLLNYLFNKLVKKLLWIIRCLLNCVFVKKKTSWVFKFIYIFADRKPWVIFKEWSRSDRYHRRVTLKIWF